MPYKSAIKEVLPFLVHEFRVLKLILHISLNPMTILNITLELWDVMPLMDELGYVSSSNTLPRFGV